MLLDVSRITAMHRDAVSRWHVQALDNPYAETDLLHTACTQHSFNFRLWHEEDAARAVDVPDSRIAEIKRAIDRLNQQRNDWIERLDDRITDALAAAAIDPPAETPQNTETVGSVVDRLSILALRIYHLQEQAERPEADPELTRSVERKLAVCRIQLQDLSRSLSELISDLAAGRKRHKTYRQFKMYNDPALNPYLSGSARSKETPP